MNADTIAFHIIENKISMGDIHAQVSLIRELMGDMRYLAEGIEQDLSELAKVHSLLDPSYVRCSYPVTLNANYGKASLPQTVFVAHMKTTCPLLGLIELKLYIRYEYSSHKAIHTSYTIREFSVPVNVITGGTIALVPKDLHYIDVIDIAKEVRERLDTILPELRKRLSSNYATRQDWISQYQQEAGQLESALQSIQ